MQMVSHPWPPELIIGDLIRIACLRRALRIIAMGPHGCSIKVPTCR